MNPPNRPLAASPPRGRGQQPGKAGFAAAAGMGHATAVAVMVAVTLMWSIAGVVTRHLEHAASFEVTFWRSFFTLLALLVILPMLQGRAVFASMRHGGRALWISGVY